MAFESAELAIEPLAAFSRGETSWSEARRRIARSLDAQFTRRLRYATLLQRTLFCQPVRAALFLTVRSPRVWRGLFRLTR